MLVRMLGLALSMQRRPPSNSFTTYDSASSRTRAAVRPDKREMLSMVAVETKTNLPLHPPLVRKPTVAGAAGAVGDDGASCERHDRDYGRGIGAPSSRGAVGVPLNGEGASRCKEKVLFNHVQQLLRKTVPV